MVYHVVTISSEDVARSMGLIVRSQVARELLWLLMARFL